MYVCIQITKLPYSLKIHTYCPGPINDGLNVKVIN